MADEQKTLVSEEEINLQITPVRLLMKRVIEKMNIGEYGMVNLILFPGPYLR